MSKRKNPLQHLDEFLKQEASSLVTPKKFSEPDKEKPVAPASSVVQEQKQAPAKPADVTIEHIIELIKKLADKNNLTMRDQLLELIEAIMENHSAGNSKDKMLINTILILKHPENWREKVEEYWGR